MRDESESDDFELGKPPIVEAWIRASFSPTDDPNSWDWDGVIKFLESYSPELDTIESLPEPPKVESVKKGKRRHELQFTFEPRYFRVRDANRGKIIQIGKSDLLVSRMRTGDATYPGFSEVRNFFEQTLERFNQSVGSRAINTLELHYVDVIEIPLPQDGKLSLSEYFLDVSEPSSLPFGETWQLSWSANLIPPESTDTAQLAFQTMPVENQSMRFRIDWHRTSRISSCSDQSVKSQLETAHKYLKSCFRSFCLGKTWALFAPSPKSKS